ncbi:MAG: hypothetical protein ACK53Y_24990, partial [bacterium]
MWPMFITGCNYNVPVIQTHRGTSSYHICIQTLVKIANGGLLTPSFLEALTLILLPAHLTLY